MRQIVYGILLMSCFSPLLYSLTIQKIAIAEEKSQLVDIQPSNSIDRFCPQDLPVAIEEIINRPELTRSRWGIEIQSLTGESLYSLEDDKFFTPASSAKLLVSAAGLLEFGANYQIKTAVYGVGNPPNLTSLRIEAKGDPSITTKSLKTILHQLQLKGIKRIENLIIDDSYFGEPQINPTWEWIDVHSYFATAVNSAILNQNAATLTLLPQQIGQPVKFFWSDAIAAKLLMKSL
jgi:serine-type D-Ala-D-Ala carboxypeptidase/endopeptidase (penicillin-binding protein 4)